MAMQGRLPWICPEAQLQVAGSWAEQWEISLRLINQACLMQYVQLPSAVMLQCCKCKWCYPMSTSHNSVHLPFQCNLRSVHGPTCISVPLASYFLRC